MHILAALGFVAARKFWVALIVAIGVFVNLYTGLDLGLDQDTVTGILAAIGPALVWLVPNRKKGLPAYTDAEALAHNNAVTGRNQDRVYRR